MLFTICVEVRFAVVMSIIRMISGRAVVWDKILKINMALFHNLSWSSVLQTMLICRLPLVGHHNESRWCVHSMTGDKWCDIKIVLGGNGSIYRYRLISESEIKCLDNIGISDISKKLISGIPTCNNKNKSQQQARCPPWLQTGCHNHHTWHCIPGQRYASPRLSLLYDVCVCVYAHSVPLLKENCFKFNVQLSWCVCAHSLHLLKEG